MKGIDDILYPIEVSNKHPYTKEIIKLAEDQGINLTEIANLMGCSQPNVSQLKAGERLAKTVDLEPLIQILSPKSPGEEFYSYTIVKSITPDLPEYWEEEVLLAGLRAASQNSTKGRYPLGDDTYHDVEKSHYDAIDREQQKLGTFLHSVKANQIQSIQQRLKDKLDLYLQDQEAIKKRKEDDQEELRSWVAETINRLTYLKDPSEKLNIEEKLIDLYEQRYFSSSPSIKSYIEADLLEACNSAADLINIPIIRSALEDGVEVFDLNAPEKHAQNVINKIEQILLEAEKEIDKKRGIYRLKGLFQKRALDSIKNLELRDPRESISWDELAENLFGQTVCKVFRNSFNDSYDVNLTGAFLLWSDEVQYKIEQEDIQVCGSLLMSKNIQDSLINIHELHSKKFLVIHTLYSNKFNEKLSMISPHLDTESLFQFLVSESEKSGWNIEKDSLISELKSTLTSRGYRVQGVRPIY